MIFIHGDYQLFYPCSSPGTSPSVRLPSPSPANSHYVHLLVQQPVLLSIIQSIYQPFCTSSSPTTSLSVHLPGHLPSCCLYSFLAHLSVFLPVAFSPLPFVSLLSWLPTLLALLSVSFPVCLPFWPFCPSPFLAFYPPGPSVLFPSSHLPSGLSVRLHSSMTTFLALLYIFQSAYPPGPSVRLPLCLPC